MIYNEKKIEQLKRLYPHGTKICCDNMADDPVPIASGTIGKVDFVDDAGQIHVNWQNGRTAERWRLSLKQTVFTLSSSKKQQLKICLPSEVS